MEAVKEHIADGAVLQTIESFLKQGAVISPLLANLYLDPLEPKTPSLPLSTGTVALPKKLLMVGG
jgi:hypothetical protein